MIRVHFLFSYIAIYLLFIACRSESDKRLELICDLAGDNREEIEKVLEHYKNEPEKLLAARFLIMNMPGHSGVDLSTVEKLQPTYSKYVEISEKHNWRRTGEWKNEINAFWEKEKNVVNLSRFSKKQDIRTVKADWLINEIDRSFKAWQENVYTRQDSFEDFCKYVLPYRFAEGICQDDSRDVFYKRHAHIFNNPDKDFREVTDSLHYLYRELMHFDWAASSMPIYNAATFEQVKRASCDDKAWYNCLMMSALGMGIAIDFVPQWGNRSGGHSWNSLIVGGETFPFEPFWDSDRWKYKKMYNNEGFDLLWGKFRLPKVYRHTFELHFDGPLGDKSVAKGDIPPLFKNPFITDVSSQYFKTTDVKITLTEPVPEDAHYCYLCVFGAQEWHPVQWGKIEGNKKVTFKGMGKDVIYLPMFYQKGVLSPAAPAFLLTQDGNYEELKCSHDKMPVTVRNYTAYLFPQEIAESKETLVGAYLIGCNDLKASVADTLYMMTDSMDTWENDIFLTNAKEYRYIQLVAPMDTVALCELSFYEKGKEDEPVQQVKVSAEITPLVDEEQLEMVADNRSATAFKGRFNNNKNRILYFDLGKSLPISKISYIPYTKNCLYKNRDIELYYWDNRWVSAGVQKGEDKNMTFNHVPKGSIYRVILKGFNDRIFTYQNGIVHWY